MLFSQLICAGCCKVLTYPLGAISCSCRNCGTVNSAQNLHVECPFCKQNLLTPINTLTFLCPCCATVTDIPEHLLPPIECSVDLGGNTAEKAARTLYVSYPTSKSTAQLKVAREQERVAVQNARKKEKELHDLMKQRMHIRAKIQNPLSASGQNAYDLRMAPPTTREEQEALQNEEVSEGESTDLLSSDCEDSQDSLVPTTIVIATRIL